MNKIKKLAFAGATTALLLGSLAGAAFASSDTGYGSQPGHDQVLEVGAQCGTGAASGAFGVFSHGGIPAAYPDPHDRAANGYQTGLNNSGVCGNRP